MGIPSDRRFLAVAAKHLRHLFPKIPAQPGYFKRRRRLTDTLEWLMGVFASSSTGILIVSLDVVAVAEKEQVLRQTPLLVGEHRAEPRSAGLSSLDVTDLRDEVAVRVDERVLATGVRALVARQRE